MIDPTHALSIVKQAEAVGISRASVYYVPRPISAADLALMRRIDELHRSGSANSDSDLSETLRRKARC